MEGRKNNKRILKGVVVSAKMEKTVVVMVEKQKRHALYDKLITKRKKYYAHNELADVKLGHQVKIIESKPISKMKRWRVLENNNKKEQ